MPHFPPVVFAIVVAVLVVALTALARRLPIPTPILQLVAGFAFGLIPGVAIPELDPNLVFFVFLPPILWSGAMFTAPLAGSKTPVIVESTVNPATSLVTTPARLLTVTENTAPLSAPVAPASV